MKIFVVDDDYEAVELMRAVLESAGHEVDANISGEQALAGIRAMQPDCVIIDLMMAALDGLELCDEIRQKPDFNNIKIIMVSARDAAHWKEKAIEHGAAGYITKPIDPKIFAGQVAELVASAT